MNIDKFIKVFMKDSENWPFYGQRFSVEFKKIQDIERIFLSLIIYLENKDKTSFKMSASSLQQFSQLFTEIAKQCFEREENLVTSNIVVYSSYVNSLIKEIIATKEKYSPKGAWKAGFFPESKMEHKSEQKSHFSTISLNAMVTLRSLDGDASKCVSFLLTNCVDTKKKFASFITALGKTPKQFFSLSLISHIFAPGQMQQLRQALSNKINLRLLNLSKCKLSDNYLESWSDLCSMITTTKEIYYLNLCNIFLNGDNFKKFTISLKRNSSIKMLDLSDHSIDVEKLEQVLTALNGKGEFFLRLLADNDHRGHFLANANIMLESFFQDNPHIYIEANGAFVNNQVKSTLKHRQFMKELTRQVCYDSADPVVEAARTHREQNKKRINEKGNVGAISIAKLGATIIAKPSSGRNLAHSEKVVLAELIIQLAPLEDGDDLRAEWNSITGKVDRDDPGATFLQDTFLKKINTNRTEPLVIYTERCPCAGCVQSLRYILTVPGDQVLYAIPELNGIDEKIIRYAVSQKFKEKVALLEAPKASESTKARQAREAAKKILENDIIQEEKANFSRLITQRLVDVLNGEIHFSSAKSLFAEEIVWPNDLQDTPIEIWYSNMHAHQGETLVFNSNVLEQAPIVATASSLPTNTEAEALGEPAPTPSPFSGGVGP